MGGHHGRVVRMYGLVCKFKSSISCVANKIFFLRMKSGLWCKSHKLQNCPTDLVITLVAVTKEQYSTPKYMERVVPVVC